jgi:hypothetical protein
LVLPGGDVVPSQRAQGSIFFVGNATVILSYAGFTILTDPNFLHRGDHVHLGHGMTAARRDARRPRTRGCRQNATASDGEPD